MFLAKCALVLCVAVAAHGYSLGPADVVFHLFSRQNPQVSEPLLPSIASIAGAAFFNPTRKTVITIHSYGEGVTGNFNAFLIPAHLAAEDVNLLAVDWTPGSAMYSIGLGNAPQVGRVIANFINILIQNFGYNANLVRIVGVGLGGHAAGIAARNVFGTVPHIVALDPSLIGWSHHPEILSSNDAAVVEVLYVTAGLYGYDKPLGTLNFYANGGTYQVGCGTDLSCSHIYGYAFYAESLTSEVNNGEKFVGTACEDYDEAIKMECSGEKDVVFGGSGDKQGKSGIYTFATNAVPPFAKG